MTETAWWFWLAFASFIILMLAIDLFLVNRDPNKTISFRSAASWSIFWIAISLTFNFLYWLYLISHTTNAIAHTKALQFLTAYIVEKSLSVDNLFVFSAIFSYFKISLNYQKRVLTYGVIGAIIMRTVIILFGTWLVSQFHWIFYIFGAILLISGYHMLVKKDEADDLNNNRILKWLRKIVPITKKLHGEKFFIFIRGKFFATPLFLVLIFIEISDLVFAIDSVPAVFGISSDPFIVLTSNIFAILGLRALYFLLAKMIHRFHLLHYGLGLVLIFISLKMLLMDLITIPTWVTLLVVLTTLSGFMLISLWKPKTEIKP